MLVSYLSIYLSKLANSVVVITGASTGIGKELTYRYAERGARLVIGARTLQALEEVRKVI